MSLTDFVLSTSLNESPAATVGARLGHLDEHDVAERVLGVLGDPDRDGVAVWPDPLVIGRVAEFGGNVHQRQPYLRSRVGGQ